MVEIREVLSNGDLKRFINFQYRLYKGNPYFVPPLFSDEMNTLRKDRNPAFEFCQARYWLAYRDGRVVGRIAAIHNPKYIERWKKRQLRFGWIDFIDDRDVSKALLDTVEAWGRELGMEEVVGPMGFTDMDKEGMLIQGFDELGTLPMIYNYPYYPEHVTALGYIKDADWLEYEIHAPSEIPEKILRINELVLKRSGLHLLDAKRSKDLLPYVMKIFDLLNLAYGDLYGFIPMTERQKKNYVDQYFPFVDPAFTKVVLDDKDNLIAFGISLPSLSRAMQKSGGRLFPFGFIPILLALKFPKALDLYLVAVRPDYQGRGINALLMTEITRSCIARGIKTAETSGELEGNQAVQDFWKHYDKRQHKRRRSFLKKL